MNNFPFIPDSLTDSLAPIDNTADLPSFSEWDFDFDTKQIKLKRGIPYLVYKNDALKIWIWKALNINMSRFNYVAYSFAYGNEIKSLISRFIDSEIRKNELKRMIKDCLLVNPYIKSLNNFVFNQEGSIIFITFDCFTIYGNEKMTTEVSL